LTDLARKVEHVACTEGDGLGYDVQSFPDGRKIFIEVKTTTGGSDSPFYMTLAELASAERLGESYCLYSVYYFDRNTCCGPILKKGLSELQNAHKQAIIYRLRFDR
jgi:hypothetical protein